jgi:hypothetical protein
MEEYLILMRLDIITKDSQPSPEQMQEYMKMYHAWIDSVAAENKFVGGKGLSTEGKVIGSDNIITDGPFAQIKESLAGFIIVQASDFDDATRLAKSCPILLGKGNSVEIRKVVSVHEK